MIPIIVLLVVFVLIAVRQVGRLRLRIWQIMLSGALVVLFTGQISPVAALKAINPDVMLFLFGVFIIGQALEDSGYLAHLSHRIFHRTKSRGSLVLLILFGMGLLSALLMNDTLAIIGTPVMLAMAAKTNTRPKILLLAMAFAVTIGSATSPIGNPQNLLIAIHGNIANPFITFFRYLLLPTLLNLFLAYLMLRLFYRKHFAGELGSHTEEPLKDPPLAKISRLSLILLASLVATRIIIVLAGLNFNFKLTYLALVAALPVIIFIPKRPGILKRMDWFTLVFFAAMFVLMQSVWDTGIFQNFVKTANLNLAATGVIFPVSILLSQLLSNVPLVALYLPAIAQLGASTKAMMALAAGSTIAGNLTILGAASNVIIIQNAEKKGGVTITFWEFVKIGVPLTAVNVAVYWLFLSLF